MTSAQPYLPQVAGGAQTSTHEIALELIGLGHEVSVLAGLAGQGPLALRDRLLLKLTGRTAVADRTQSYPVYRAWFSHMAVAETVRRVKPDVAFIPTSKGVPLGLALQDAGVPIIVYLRDVEFHELDGSLSDIRGALYVANSQFTADSYRQAFGISAEVVPPLFQPDLYRTETSRKYVTFVNPHKKKGVDIALELADRCPDIPFAFISGWALPNDDAEELQARVAQLHNVTLKPRTTRMRDIYAETKILLAPSRWAEAWGRVVSEAHYSGIPAIATNVGGLGESVGPGGVLIDRDAPIDAWVEALNGLWRDPARYAAASEAALAYSGRPQLDRRHQIAKLVEMMQAAVAGGPFGAGR